MVRRAGHVKRIDPVDKICQQLPPEEVYKQFGRASKLLLHPKDVPDIKLQEKEEMINREIQNEEEENTTLCEMSTDEKISEEPINRLGNKGPLGPTVKWTVTGRCVFPAKIAKNRLITWETRNVKHYCPMGGKKGTQK